jgi:pectate lyase
MKRILGMGTAMAGLWQMLWVGAEPASPQPPQPKFSPMGFAHLGSPVTGGGTAEPIRVRTVQELRAQAATDEPRVLLLEGRFDLAGQSVRVGSHKTLLGTGEGAVLTGGALHLRNVTNVILRNLVIRDSPEDGISLSGALHVWVDHCTIMDCGDGLIDLTHGTDLVTISWCRFGYENLKNPHRLASLLGASDRDHASRGRLCVTYHHNWWDAGCLERMPSVRFGRVHVFNNYYRAPGNRYCIRSRLYAECRIEFNWFEDVRNPWELLISTGDTGRIFAAGNVEVNTSWERGGGNLQLVSGTDSVFVPPYPWRPDPPQWVPWLVTNYAGAGRGPFAR